MEVGGGGRASVCVCVRGVLAPSRPCQASGVGMAQKPPVEETERLVDLGGDERKSRQLRQGAQEMPRSSGSLSAVNRHLQFCTGKGLGLVGAAYRRSLRPRTRAAPAASSFLLAQPVRDAWQQ